MYIMYILFKRQIKVHYLAHWL